MSNESNIIRAYQSLVPVDLRDAFTTLDDADPRTWDFVQRATNDLQQERN